MIPNIFWASSALIFTTCTSAFILTIQRGLRHNGIRLEEDDQLIKDDYKRDLSVPFADNNRLTRLGCHTLILAALSALDLFKNKNDIWQTTGYLFIFVSWLYALVLAITSRHYQLPNKWGWILNVHLCILYCMAWTVSIYQFCDIAILRYPDMDWIHCLPYMLRVLLGFDLVYVTATVKQGPPFLDENGRQVCNINVESIMGFLFLNWCSGVVHTAATKQDDMVDHDMPVLTPKYRAANLLRILNLSRGKGLISRIIQANKFAFLTLIIVTIPTSVMYYVPIYCMNRLLQFLQDYKDNVHFEHPMFYGSVLVIGMGVSIIILGFLLTQQWYYATCDLQTRVGAMLNVEVYRKALRRRDASTVNSEQANEIDKDTDAAAASSSGAVVNLMGTDSSRIALFSGLWISSIGAPVELVIGIYFLYQLIGMSTFIGLLIMIIILPVNHYNSKIMSKTQDRLMEARDKRVSLMNEVLQGIRQIKFFAWEKNWEERIMEARKVELGQLAITYINGVFFSLVWQGAPILVTLFSFFSFTKIEGKELTAPIAFTVISVFSEFRYALNVIPETIIDGIAAYSSIKRIQKFLEEDEIDPIPAQDPLAPVDISFNNATIAWKKTDEDEEASFILKDMNAQFPNGELSLISGSTGSGKTLLLLGLLGEAVLLDGQVNCPRTPISDTPDSEIGTVSADLDDKEWILSRSVAYVSQTPWLQNASIKDNILFGLPCIDSRYKQTLYACALDKDLSIFEDGDRTEIGEKGITLSGGQKARVALARAVYSRAQNVLMDDVLSAVDAHTAKHLYEECLMGPLMKNRTRILVTHHVKLCLKGCGLLVHIEGGRANHVGTPAELRQSGELALIIEEESAFEDEEDANEEEAIENTVDNIAPALQNVEEKKARVLVEEESRASGAVKLKLYSVYLGMVGKTGFWVLMAAILCAARGFEIGESWWVKKWAQSYDTYPDENANTTSVFSSPFAMTESVYIASNKPSHSTPSDGVLHLNYYLGVYGLISLSSVIFGSLRYAFLYWGALRANKRIYSELLRRVFRAPLRFFDTTPMGRILNRFSKDFEAVDSKIPTSLMDCTVQWIVIFSSAATICFVMPSFVVPMVFIIIVNFLVGIDYISSSRELKRLDSVTRSPVFSNFTETIAGVSTIRAYGVSQQFLRVMMKTIDANVRPFFYSWSVTRWIGIRFSMTSAFINFAACGFTLWRLGEMDVALAGFGLSFILMFTTSMLFGIRMYTSLEMSFNAVERIVEFMEMDQEAPAIMELRPPSGWPTKGAIEVKDLEVRYAADLDPVLRGISFNIKPQEKIGVVGRTGSGKSTLALSFFRFIEASEGSIVIDGINIKDIGIEDLRSNLTIIPQDPTLFSGTLRSNMDPFNQFDDESIFAAFRRVHLIPSGDNSTSSSIYNNSEEVNANVFKDLDTAVSENGKNFSQGQRQLLCLARALLKRSRIVLMDEATASVDFYTDKAIQKTLSTEFSDSTILCIAHRLHTVIEYDRILVLDHGKILEFDNPLALIKNPESVFYEMCRNSGEFDALLELAQGKHQMLKV